MKAQPPRAAASNGSPAPPAQPQGPPHVNAHARPFHPQTHAHPHAHPHPHAYGHPHGHPHADGPPRGPPHHLEYRPKGGVPQHPVPDFPEPMPLPDGGVEMPPPAHFKPGAGVPLQPHARPYHVPAYIAGGPNGPIPGGVPPAMGGPMPMRGPPGPHGYQRMRGPPRGSAGMPSQNYPGPRSAMNARGQPFYMPQQMHPAAYGMMAPQHGGPAPYMPPGPMPGYPGVPNPAMGMGMGMNHMPPPHAHTAHAAPPPQQREKKVLQIVNPSTGKAIDLPSNKAASSSASTTASTPATSAAPSTPAKAEGADKPVAKMTATEEPPKAKSPAKKSSKQTIAHPGAAEEMKAKVLAMLAAAKQEPKQSSDAAPSKPDTTKKAEEKQESKPATQTPAVTKSSAPSSSSTGSPKKSTEKSVEASEVVASPKKTPKKSMESTETASPKKQPASPKKTTATKTKTTTTTISAEGTKTTTTTTSDTVPTGFKQVVSSPKQAVTSPKSTSRKTPQPSPTKTKALPPSPKKKTKDAAAEKEPEAPKEVATVTTVDVVNSVAVTKNNKLTYSLEVLVRFRDIYKELPTESPEGPVKWPSMEIINDGPVRARGGRGGGGAGWERGGEKGGLNRQSSRASSGGGNQWQRSQEPPKRGRSERGGRGGRGGRGAPEPLFDGPVKPLERSENRWIPVKASSNLEAAKKKVQSIMNKMTREKFDRLASQITEINMESLEMLQAVITIIFDKALGEPHFCDMYADLCVHLEQNWKVWTFLKIVKNDDDDKFYWTTMAESDSEVVGPFENVSDALDSAGSDEFEPAPAPENMKLHEVRIRENKFIKIWTCEPEEGQEREYYWSGQLLEDLGTEQTLNGPFESHDLASRFAIKSCSFKRILLNACQEEFEKDNIYEELEEQYKKDKEAGTMTAEAAAEYEEKRIIMKGRMLGNIRFIGELYRKGMLQERIMHECVMKLMGVKATIDSLEPSHPTNAPDEESIESLCKLLTTMGKDLERKNQGAMAMYFSYMEKKLVKDKRLSSRITFMIRDIIEMRENNWQPRRKELQSKSLNEIRKEAEREQRAPPASAPGRPDAFRMDNRRSASSRDGGFSQRSTTAQVYQSQSMSSRSGGANKMQLPDRRNFQRDDSVKSGPQGRPASFGSARRPPSSAGPMLGKKPAGKGDTTPKNKDRPSSPAAAPPLSDDDKEKIAKKTKSFAEEYVSIVDLNEAEACCMEIVKEFKSHREVHGVIASEILKQASEAKADTQRAMFDLLEKLSVEKSSLTFEGIRTGIRDVIEFGNDLWCDVPKLHEHLAGFIVRFAKVSDKSGVTLDWMMGDCVQSLDAEVYEELIAGGFLAEVCGCMLKALVAINVEKAKSQVRNANVTLLSLFPDYKQNHKDFKMWIDKHGIEDALGLSPAIGFAQHWADSKNLQETVEWYHKTLSEDVQKDPVFASLACMFVLNSVKKGDLPSDDEGMLLNGLCVSVESQTRLVGALFQTRGVIPEDADEFKKLLKHLVKELHAIPALALSKWLELKSDNSVGRKRALAAFGDFVEELAKSK